MTKILISISSKPATMAQRVAIWNSIASKVKDKTNDLSKILSEKLGVKVTGGIKHVDRSKFYLDLKVQHGRGQKIVVQSILWSDYKKPDFSGLKYDSAGTITLEGTDASKKFALFCTKVLGKPALNPEDFVTVIKKFIESTEGAKKVTLPPKDAMEVKLAAKVKAAKSIISELKKAGLGNVYVERYAMGGFGISAVYRPVKGKAPGYEIKKTGDKYIVSKCIGPYFPPTAEFTKKLKTFSDINAVVDYLKSK